MRKNSVEIQMQCLLKRWDDYELVKAAMKIM